MNTKQAFQETASLSFLIGTIMFCTLKAIVYLGRTSNFTSESIWIFSIAYFVGKFLMARFMVCEKWFKKK